MTKNSKSKKNLLSGSVSNNLDEQISFGDDEKLEEKSLEKKMVTVTFDPGKLDQFKDENGSHTNQKSPSMFRAPFSFEGRIRRLEYGLSYMVSYFLLQVFSVMFIEIPIMILICVFVYMWFNLAQGAKRCHDRGNSGWFQIIPFYGLWMLFGDGDRGENQYGINPKGRI